MVKIFFKALIWGIAVLIILNVLIFFGAGFYGGFTVSNLGVYVPPTFIIIFRYASLFLAFGVAVFVFLTRKKQMPPLFSQSSQPPPLQTFPPFMPPESKPPVSPLEKPFKQFEFPKEFPPVQPSEPTPIFPKNQNQSPVSFGSDSLDSMPMPSKNQPSAPFDSKELKSPFEEKKEEEKGDIHSF
ncbi:MAG: hypothetical protein HYW71_02875 [Candidatus Niyogibacteria bacterium]|nr:hypothetical protein [Candidatus Niyogibacteria bacterium]